MSKERDASAKQERALEAEASHAEVTLRDDSRGGSDRASRDGWLHGHEEVLPPQHHDAEPVRQASTGAPNMGGEAGEPATPENTEEDGDEDRWVRYRRISKLRKLKANPKQAWARGVVHVTRHAPGIDEIPTRVGEGEDLDGSKTAVPEVRVKSMQMEGQTARCGRVMQMPKGTIDVRAETQVGALSEEFELSGSQVECQMKEERKEKISTKTRKKENDESDAVGVDIPGMDANIKSTTSADGDSEAGRIAKTTRGWSQDYLRLP